MMSYFEKITEPFLVQAYVILSATSFSLSLVTIITAKYFFDRRFKQDECAVQSAHKGLVPRMGGLAIYSSIVIFTWVLNPWTVSLSFLPNLDVGNLYLLIVSAIPVFLVGLAEDLGYKMSPKIRLFASMISGLLVVFFFQVWVSSVGVPGLDIILSLMPLGVIFTLFASTGVVNAFNLVDGLNGLTGYIAISTAVSLSIIAFKINDTEMLRFLFILAASVMGFFVLNYPFGKIFLGDSGAYTLGHLFVWSAILIANSSSSISPFSILLVFFWPVADTLVSIWRRWSLKRLPYQPDRLHFHQLVMRFLEIRFLGRTQRNISNPLATIFLIPVISVPQLLGVIYWNNFAATVWTSVFFGFLFVCSYIVGINLAKKSRKIKCIK